MRNTKRTTQKLAISLALVLGLGACVVPSPPLPSTVEEPPEAFPRSDEAAYTDLGPYTPAVTTVEVGERLVEIWYPSDTTPGPKAETDVYDLRDFISPALDSLLPDDVGGLYVTNAYRDLPAASGEFPLVIFTHGFLAFRTSSSFLTSHLASWGFVVAAPDMLERGLYAIGGDPLKRPLTEDQALMSVYDEMKSLDSDPTSALAGRIDTSTVFPVGHSMGGFASTMFAQNDFVKAWIPLAAGSFLPAFNPLPDNEDHTKAAMWMGGRNDKTVNIGSIIEAHEWTPGPSKLVIFEDSGHLTAFTEICEIGDQGGAVGLALAVGLPLPEGLIELGTDGCKAPNAPSPDLWPAANHFITAELRYRSGLDSEPVGLGAGVLENLSGVNIEYTHDP